MVDTILFIVLLIVVFVFIIKGMAFVVDYFYTPVTSSNIEYIRVIEKKIITDEYTGKSAYIVFLDFPEDFGKAIKVKKEKYDNISIGECVKVKIKELEYMDDYFIKCKIKKNKGKKYGR